MFRLFIIFGLLFLSIFAFYSTRKDRDTGELQLSRLDVHSSESGTGTINPDSEMVLNNENAKNLNESPKKSELKEVSMSPQEIKQLKLKDFHSYLRHEDRVIRQADTSTTDYILTPAQQKEIAKERLAVRLIEQLGSQKTQ